MCVPPSKDSAEHGLRLLAHPGGDPCGEHDAKDRFDTGLGAGEGLAVIRQRFVHGLLPLVAGIQLPGSGGQLDEDEIEDGVVDDVVALIGQAAVDVAEQTVRNTSRFRLIPSTPFLQIRE